MQLGSRRLLAIVLGSTACALAVAQTQPASAQPGGAHAVAGAATPASAATGKKKHASRAKTPPGKPARGTAPCNQGDKAQQKRCLQDLYGPGAAPHV